MAIIKSISGIRGTIGGKVNENLTPIDKSSIPGCTYCRPQVASIGLTEKRLPLISFISSIFPETGK